MPSPVFTLEALQAAHGDSLLLHYGDRDNPKLIVIDGGPDKIFESSLEPRLKSIQTARGGGVLNIRMVMVSHIDEDHVAGVLALMKVLRKLRDENRPLPYDVLTLWHNSFDDIIASLSPNMPAELQSADVGRKDADAAAIVANVDQGRRLRRDADALAINMNSGFDDLIHFDKNAKPLKISKELMFRVLGPRKAEIDNLEKDWKAFLEKEKAKKAKGQGKASLSPTELNAIAAAFLDNSVANLSSVVVIAESAGKRMLLTGDARGNLILDSLREAKLLKNGLFPVDIFKVAHHGSNRNSSEEMFRTIPARHYVISADGKNGNPDNKTFDELFAGRPSGPYDIWLTNPVTKAVNHINATKPSSVTLHVRGKTEPSLKVELRNKIAW